MFCDCVPEVPEEEDTDEDMETDDEEEGTEPQFCCPSSVVGCFSKLFPNTTSPSSLELCIHISGWSACYKKENNTNNYKYILDPNLDLLIRHYIFHWVSLVKLVFSGCCRVITMVI